MGGPAARCLALLAAAAATRVAAAADRFVPGDPSFIVVEVGAQAPDESLRQRLALWRERPDEASAVALADLYLERARQAREPRLFGRAEALLAPRAGQPGAGAGLRRRYAETLQFRHAFAAAAALLDQLLRENPRDASARLQRASLRLTRGDFAGARADCAQLTTHAALAPAGFACLAQALAGSGQLERGRLLLDAVGAADSRDPAMSAYLLATRAELHERSGGFDAAIADYRAALRLAPHDDALRAAMADALGLRGDGAAALRQLAVDKPSLALLVRSAAWSAGPQRQPLVQRARDWLALESARGDAIHHREAALLALAESRTAEALRAARENFRTQRELPDVRVLARAAVAARDAGARNELESWLQVTGFQDAVTAAVLAGTARG
jgi:tetratricopeptide (TPR) repeat protein